MRIVDISNALETGIPSDPPMMLPGIEYVAHEDSVGQTAAAFPGLTADHLDYMSEEIGNFQRNAA